MKSLIIEADNRLDQEKAFNFLKPFYHVSLINNEKKNSSEDNIEYYNRRDFKKRVLEVKENDFLTLNGSNDNFFYLVKAKTSWHLLDSEQNILSIDFDEDKINYQRKNAGKSDILIKSIGKKSQNVLDVSCGLAVDSVFLLNQGYNVCSLERNPLVFFLLNEAKLKSNSDVIQSWTLGFGDACSEVTKEIITSKKIDVVYFDPMFPHKKKEALSKQEMQLFKNLVGSDDDCAAILKKLISYGIKVVVKRPLKGDYLLEKPKNIFEGNSIRFEIY